MSTVFDSSRKSQSSPPDDEVARLRIPPHSIEAEQSVLGGLLLDQSVPSAANLRRYAEIVRERAVLRKLVAASDEIATNAFNPQGRPVSQILDEAEGMIFKIGEEGSRSRQGFQSM